MKENIKENKLYILATNVTKSIDRSIKVINILLITSIIIVILIFFKHYTRKIETYFAKSIVGNTIPMLPLTKFNVSPRSLLNWAMVATTNAFTLDFENYPKTLEQISEFFTESGFEQFKESLNKSGRLNDIIEKKLISSAVIVDCPVIVAEGIQGKNYLWKIQLPVAITYQGASENTYKQWVVVNLLVKKVPNKELKKGIGIEEFTDQEIAPMY